jgi:deoxyribodipyrimidine photo-lyase
MDKTIRTKSRVVKPNRSGTVQPARIQVLNQKGFADGSFVLYWMQQSQRAQQNHALEYAAELANHLKKPLLAVFGLTADYPEANQRHYRFMLEGLRETQAALARRKIKLVVRAGHPADVALAAGKRASVIVCDRGYLRHQKEWRQNVARGAGCRVVQVESDVVVPVDTVSGKAEYAARTIRPKIHRHLSEFLTGIRTTAVRKSSMNQPLTGLNLKRLESVLEALPIDTSVGSVSHLYPGGTAGAKKRFAGFLKNGLQRYDRNSNQPQTDDVSHMSMYLHFGQISPLFLARQVEKARGAGEDNRAAYLEELIVRRELAINFVHQTPNYDNYGCLPRWARQSLAEHRSDKRPHLYSRRQLENADTHDPYWNAAMEEMKYTGFMHNYMRMYWGKKILEWSQTPKQAFETTLALNNKYFIDGRDPNSFTGVAWIYGLHDRPWVERPIFGKVRYMAASGLERKCDIQAYVRKVQKRKKEAQNER